MIDPEDAFFDNYDLISNLGSKYANCDEYSSYVEYICVVLNRMTKTESYSHICDIQNNTIISVKDRPNIIIGSFYNVNYSKVLCEFLENEILLFKLDIIK